MKELDVLIEQAQKDVLFDIDHQLKNVEDLLQENQIESVSWKTEFYYTFLAFAFQCMITSSIIFYDRSWIHYLVLIQGMEAW